MIMGNAKFAQILVERYVICDDDENVYEAENNLDFDESCSLLERLRDEDPGATYTLFAVIDA